MFFTTVFLNLILYNIINIIISALVWMQLHLIALRRPTVSCIVYVRISIYLEGHGPTYVYIQLKV